jgi:hypothetical protein
MHHTGGSQTVCVSYVWFTGVQQQSRRMLVLVWDLIWPHTSMVHERCRGCPDLCMHVVAGVCDVYATCCSSSTAGDSAVCLLLQHPALGWLHMRRCGCVCRCVDVGVDVCTAMGVRFKARTVAASLPSVLIVMCTVSRVIYALCCKQGMHFVSALGVPFPLYMCGCAASKGLGWRI